MIRDFLAERGVGIIALIGLLCWWFDSRETKPLPPPDPAPEAVAEPEPPKRECRHVAKIKIDLYLTGQIIGWYCQTCPHVLIYSQWLEGSDIVRSSSWAGRNPAATAAGTSDDQTSQTRHGWSPDTGKSNDAATAASQPDPASTPETTPTRSRSLRRICDWLRHWGIEFGKTMTELLGHDYSTPIRYPPRRYTGTGGTAYADATLSAAAGNLVAMLTVIDRATYDRIADDLAVIACTKGDPRESDHNHAACLETPGALLADHLWRIVAPLADGNGKAARIAVRRLDQAMGAGEIHQ